MSNFLSPEKEAVLSKGAIGVSYDNSVLYADMINHPPHYTMFDIECIEEMEKTSTPEEMRGYFKNTIKKYIYRAGHKHTTEEDLEKTKWFIERWIHYEKQRGRTRK